MTKPTGRPRGRPKTKEYETLMCRVDTALADQVRRYAGLHRQTISDILRDGLQALLSEQDPWHPITSDDNRDATRAFLSDRNETPLDMLVGETNSTEREALLSATPEPVIDTILSDTNRDNDIVSDTKEAEVIVSDAKAAPAPILSDAQRGTDKASDRNADEGFERVAAEINAALAPLFSPSPRKGRATKTGPTPIMSDTKTDDTGRTGYGAPAPRPAPDKGALVARLHQMRDQGMSLAQIADQLQAEDVPTLSGTGQWRKGTVDNLLRGR